MCTKISTFLLIMASVMMMIQKEIVSLSIVNRDDVISEEETKDDIVENIGGEIGRYTFLNCPDLNGTAKYTWLKNNELLEDSIGIQRFNNGTGLRVKVTSKSIGNYTCKCEVAGCKSYTFHLYAASDARTGYVEELENFFDMMSIRVDIIRGLLNIFGKYYEKSVYIPRQNLSADFQRVFVKKVDKVLTTRLILMCQDEMYLGGEGNYIWLKNNVTINKTNESDADGQMLHLTLSSEEQSGNYTCLCKDTSCIPYNHTYQVIIGSSEKKESNHQSNLTSNQTQSSTLWPNVIDMWSSLWHKLQSFASMIKISERNRAVIKLSTAAGLEKLEELNSKYQK